MGKLVKTRLLEVEELVLVQLDGEGGEGDPLLHHPVEAGQVACLPAPGREGHCENWEQGQDYEIPAAAQQQVTRGKMSRCKIV